MTTKLASYLQIILNVNTSKIVGCGLETIPGFFSAGHMVITEGIDG